jgi:hypothetical protein
MEKYFGYANLVLTDYVEFRFYESGIKYQEPTKIAEYGVNSRTINPLLENNKIAKAKFSVSGLAVLLTKYDILIE